MNQEQNNDNEQGSFSKIKLGELLNPTEISEVKQLFKTNKLIEAKQYLNEPDRKNRLEDKGVVADYLYYILEFELT